MCRAPTQREQGDCGYAGLACLPLDTYIYGIYNSYNASICPTNAYKHGGVGMEKPTVSPDFTIEDIHKIREYNYEVTKGMNWEEQLAYYRKSTDTVSAQYSGIKSALERGWEYLKIAQ